MGSLLLCPHFMMGGEERSRMALGGLGGLELDKGKGGGRAPGTHVWKGLEALWRFSDLPLNTALKNKSMKRGNIFQPFT